MKTTKFSMRVTFPSENKSSSRLVSRPSFWVGMGSLMNIAGNYFDFNYSKTGVESDVKAIGRDWEIVGETMSGAISLVGSENE